MNVFIIGLKHSEGKNHENFIFFIYFFKKERKTHTLRARHSRENAGIVAGM